MEFSLDTEETVLILFLDHANSKTRLDQIDILWYYENNWSFQNLFYGVEVVFLSIDGKESTLDELRSLIGIPESMNGDSDFWSFNPHIANVEIVQSIKLFNQGV